MSFSRILLSTDFSECSREAAKFAGIIAKNFDSEIYLVHVLSDFRSEYASLLEETPPQFLDKLPLLTVIVLEGDHLILPCSPAEPLPEMGL